MSRGKTRARELRLMNASHKRTKKQRNACIKYMGRWMTQDEYLAASGAVAENNKKPLRLKDFDKEAMGGRTFRWIAEDGEWEEITDYNYPAKPRKREPKTKLCREEMTTSPEEVMVPKPFYDPGYKTIPYLEWASEKVEQAVEFLAKKWFITLEEVKIVPSQANDKVQ